jgi:hypothetical protein
VFAIPILPRQLASTLFTLQSERLQDRHPSGVSGHRDRRPFFEWLAVLCQAATPSLTEQIGYVL